ncbi:MAG TPA: DUF4097 family beta strand repeat-containing protein [Gemmatimonadaceae bacterium]|jgi:hypothetical protein
MTMTLRITVAAALLAVASANSPLAAQNGAKQTDDTFDWSGTIPSGSWLRVQNLNGSVSVEAATGDVAEVHAKKDWRGSADPRRVRIVTINDGSNVTICALWHDDDTCDAGGYHSHHDGNDRATDRVSVAFTVKLPRGVKIKAATVNGEVSVHGAQALVQAHTVNGSVDASSSTGPLEASTVNGDLRVSMDALTGDGDLNYETVNGSITVHLPSHLDANVDMQTVNGSLTSDFPLTLTGRINPRRHLSATIGNGGRHINLKTVNGNVELRKSS